MLATIKTIGTTVTGEIIAPPEVQQQMEQMSQMIEQLTATVNQQAQHIENRKADLDSRERIAAMNNATRLTETEAKLGHESAIVELREQLAMMRADMDRLAAARQEEDAEEEEQEPQPQAA